jgi:hypothetical protein
MGRDVQCVRWTFANGVRVTEWRDDIGGVRRELADV